TEAQIAVLPGDVGRATHVGIGNVAQLANRVGSQSHAGNVDEAVKSRSRRANDVIDKALEGGRTGVARADRGRDTGRKAKFIQWNAERGHADITVNVHVDQPRRDELPAYV